MECRIVASGTRRAEDDALYPYWLLLVETGARTSELLGVSYTSAHEGARAGTLPVQPIRIGRQYRFPKPIVDRLLGLDDIDPVIIGD